MRLALVYATLDGSPIVAIEHLRAALAVWRYSEGSARIVFSGSQSGVSSGVVSALESEPLPVRLLKAIVRQPGINRTGLHEATGNRIKSIDMEPALGVLEFQGLARRSPSHSESGGRPGECWWPGTSLSSDPESGVFTFTMGGDADEDAAVVASEVPSLPISAADLIRSHEMSAGEDVGGGGDITPTPDVSIGSGHVPTIITAMRGNHAHAEPEEGSSPSKCSCGAEVDRVGDEYCTTCFEAALSEALA
ncbi:MAG: hypothetical protein ACLQIB_34010 [Isosphaeraceae bacterium]